ncbi:zinc finger, C3HC4 type (RING finger) protein (macronuclear) [Tetrahymena thermophila SB210]|uniref:Zinc finger, C3HC4 type (RING finger) protein n=1 Tax=Tetrahymena thermophila (strain SB210) TaxID=312017 RepID=I7MCG6_TETTS|nr:zinc finger, C3HC4 type (RING finger) protein [Tetrahymena thermophila SB210]EAR83908.2 zinc finger, C3HC4 type (RING finger) protein [Tetrahymena thermophila SB210]|eukprot:XP_001031571.2 zinc finger, C3HC4 type (RING finger) protein [Tetrahymena thermophila SB210]
MEKVDSILTKIIIKISSSYISLISNFTLIILQKIQGRDENQRYCVIEYSFIQNSQKELIDTKPILILTLEKSSSKAIETRYTILFVFGIFFFKNNYLESSAFNRFSDKKLLCGFKFKLSSLFFRDISIQQAEDSDSLQSTVIKQLSTSQIINQDCSICLDKLQTGQTVSIITECQHYYHQECIENWFQCNKTCPLCRTQIFIL